jgi:hypothetical protein
MSNTPRSPWDRDTQLDNFVADLTRVAYRVALQHGTAGVWVDLELDLWRALADVVQGQWRGSIPDSETFACDWAASQSEAGPGDVRDGPVYRRIVRGPLSGE